MNIETLKKVKKEKKITYEQLSQMSGIPISTIYDLFRGVTTAPRIDTVVAIEKALGLKPTAEWAEEEKALGVGRHATYLTEEEYEWLELRSEVLRTHGEKYLQTLITMIKAVIEKVPPKS